MAAQALPQAAEFLSGESGTVGGLDGVRRALLDRLYSFARHLLTGERELRRAVAEGFPPTEVLVLAAWRKEREEVTKRIEGELLASHHHITLARAHPAPGVGRLNAFNRLLPPLPVCDRYEWLLLVDDDVALPKRFLDRFLFLARAFRFDLAQPAHLYCSHAAWPLTRRRWRLLARQTAFVEIGPVVALHRNTFPHLLPFPELGMGWGVDAYWAALARERGLRCGVVDATPIRHLLPSAQHYNRDEAVAQARAFLARHPYLPVAESQRTLASYRRLHPPRRA